MANPWIPYLKPSVGGGEVFLILFLLVFLKVFILSGHLSPEIIFFERLFVERRNPQVTLAYDCNFRRNSCSTNTAYAVIPILPGVV
jgi:hypothetical protein